MNTGSPHVLYRMYDSRGQLLYVGITIGVEGRFRGHRSTKSWWAQVRTITLEHHPSRPAVLSAEQAAIEAEAPLFNIRGTAAQDPELNSLIDASLDGLDRERAKRLRYQAKYGAPPRSRQPRARAR